MEAGSHSSSSRKNVGNMRWRPSESKFFLQFMATQVENGLKCDKTFKPPAIHAAIRALRENFGKDCMESNVHNHLRTLKRRWAIIRRLREMSGVGWEYENKKIIMAEEECMTYLMSHPNEEPYINKPIEEYDLLEVVCGNDHATERFARDSIGTPPTDAGVPNFSQDNFNIGLTQEDLGHGQFDSNYGFETPSPTPNSSQARTSQEAQTRKKGKKRDASADSVLAQTVGSKMDRLALVIEEHNPVTLTMKLSEACMKLTEVGYSTRDVAKVYSYYADSETRTIKFLGAPDILRQYMAEELVGPPGQNF